MHLPEKLIIAIDGYSSCGKSTFAKTIAQKLGYTYIDTGAMYRAITLYALENHLIDENNFYKQQLINQLDKIEIDFKRNDQNGKNEIYLNGKNVEELIRNLRVSQFVSQISAVKEVREKLVNLQRKIGSKGNVVMDGRDIGTVVFPEAQLKIFMTADPKIRAQRRYAELIAKGQQVSFDEVYKNVIERDNLDTSREESPLRKAPDAIILDNSHMTPEEQWQWFENLIHQLFK